MVKTRQKPGVYYAWRRGMVPAVMIILSISAGRSDAYFPHGGFGFGFDFRDRASRTTDFLNTWSLQMGARAAANRPERLTAPRFQSRRDDSWLEKYDLETREAMINRIARDPARQMRTANPAGRRPAATKPQPPQPAAEPEPKPVVLLADFFDRSRNFVWPSVAPTAGDLGKKQEAVDQAILAVLNEYDSQGLAHLSSVSAARQKLLDYGRPALAFVSNQTTPAIADTFNAFLVSVYTQLGLAGSVPKAP